MRTDGQTDMTKLPVAFRNFAKEPKKDRYSVDFYISDGKPDRGEFFSYLYLYFGGTH